MRFIKISLVCLFSLAWVGCASRPLQTDHLGQSTKDIVASRTIEGVGFIDQTAGYCGPSTLTMAMQWAGLDISIDEIAPLVYTPLSKGSFPADLISASRRAGLMALPINTMKALLTEVAHGNPVIIFENLGLSWATQWHYALVVGYDLSNKQIILHSGHTAYQAQDMKSFERSWQMGDYWGLVVLSPEMTSPSASERDHLVAAVGLQQAKKYKEAEISFREILKKWPNSLVALIGLGNLSYKNGDRIKSIYWLDRAVTAHPDSKVARHNLSVLLEN